VSRRDELAAGLARVQDRIVAACAAAGRPREDVTLVAVTKTWPASDCALLRDLGVHDLGENREQEAAAKAREVEGVRWHLVGQLQTNKARSVAQYAYAVHAVDRPRLVHALSEAAVRAGRELRVLLQLSLDGDPARGGALEADLPALADLVADAEGLRLSGVMAVAPLGAPPAPAFARLAAVAQRVRTDHPEAGWLSAGMSGDLEEAVAAGATHVRVGSAILGARPPLLG
jgi:pyridoxal phosphate enzyme (YggS family)